MIWLGLIAVIIIAAILAAKSAAATGTVKTGTNSEAQPDISDARKLEEMFARLKTGEISLDDYHDEIIAAKAGTDEEMALLREQRSFLTDEEYEAEKDILVEARDEIAWRLSWVEKRLRDQSLLESRPEISGGGRWARFEYVDHDGVITDRDIARWEVSGRYVRGYDRKRKAERNFRIDRISNWKAG